MTTDSSFQKAQAMDLPSARFYKLDRVREAVAACGHPERGRECIIVAGTNGKGSVVSMLGRLLEKTGRKVGTYFSPHILHRTERICINHEEISEDALQDLERRYQDVLMKLTYFEQMTLLAWLYFREQQVDCQVLEVGVGGRLDATNVSEPQMSVITKIDYDHQDVLGESLSQIAGEKAGVLREGRPFLFGREDRSEVRSVFEDHARKLNCPMTDTGQIPFEESLEQKFSSFGLRFGEHQNGNARLAWCAFEQFVGKSPLQFMSLNEAFQILAEALPLARIQILSQEKPLIVVDGSHNPSAVRVLREQLDRKFPEQTFEILLGCMEGKDIHQILEILDSKAKTYHVLSFYPPREMPPAELKKKIESFSDRPVIFHSSFESFLNLVRENSQSAFLCAGSFYLAGEFLKRWNPSSRALAS